MERLDDAVAALRDGDLVVYPTETVYGLGADATDSAAVERVFAAKGRDRDEPVSIAVPDVDAASKYADPSPRARRFMAQYLPGPVTVVVDRGDAIPDVVTGGRERVGIRVPAHDGALALLDRVAPVTATSANPTGGADPVTADDVHPDMRAAASVVLDGGEGSGAPTTVVDVDRNRVHRDGPLAEEIRAWLRQDGAVDDERD